MKRQTRNLVAFAVGLALLVGVVWYLGPRAAWEALGTAGRHPGLLAAALGLFALAQVGFLAKWHLIARLAGAEVDLRQSLRLFGTLYLIGTFTPGRAGELAVPLLMHGGGKLTAVALVNRLLEGAWTLAAGILAAFIVFRDDPGRMPFWFFGLVLVGFIIVMGVLRNRRATEALRSIVRASLRPLQRLRAVTWLLEREQRYKDSIEEFHRANARLLRPWAIFLFGVLMLGIWVAMISTNYLLIDATIAPGGKAVPFAVIFAVMIVNALAIYLSPIPGGLGVSEISASALFGYLGYEADKFITFLLLARLMLYATVILFYLVGRAAGRDLAPAAAGAEAPRRISDDLPV